MTGGSATVTLSLAAHTNVGKTTLARTLLGRDIGEVRDEAHVTVLAERHTMVEAPDGARLELWDTPGFGDSVRLGKRLALVGHPLGWLLSEVWDRFRDRAFWSNQHAVRNVLDHADVVLYLVNAAEAPEDVGYLDAELHVLDLAGKPVLVLLNQLGQPRPGAQAEAEVQRWRDRCARAHCVREVLALDAFARCWVQEGLLLRSVAAALPASKLSTFGALEAAWHARQHATWQAAMGVLSDRLARAALDREALGASGLASRLKDWGAALGLRRDHVSSTDRAMDALAERLDGDIRASTDRLIALHGLEGRAGAQVLARLAEHYAARKPLDEGKAAVWGGVVSGALLGLKADIASGGLTLGGGLLAGGVLGALGALGVAKGVNKVRGIEEASVAWSERVLDELARSALLGYLAVIHYGRGRGAWVAGEHPAFWAAEVDAVMARHTDALHTLWALRSADAGTLTEALHAWLRAASEDLLRALYPASTAFDRR